MDVRNQRDVHGAEDASGFIKDNYVNHTADEMAEAFDLLQQGIAVLLTSPD